MPRVRDEAAVRNRTLLRILEREREAFALERARLIDTICHLAGRSWTLAPADMVEPEPEPGEPTLIVPDHWSDDDL